MRRLLWVSGALLVGALALVGVAGWVASGLWQPADASAQARAFVIESGEPLQQVVRRLGEQGLLSDRLGLGARTVLLYAKFKGLDRRVKSGEYELSAAQSPREILEKICAGEVATHAVTLPEGLNVWEIAARLEAQGIAPAKAVLELALSPAFARELGVEADSLEGYLYPETYRFERGSEAAAALRVMVEQSRSRWSEADRAKLASSGRTLHEVMTIASIVEKETAVPAERPLVAAVYLNRLRRKMRLMSDPTVIYGLLREQGSFSGNLRKVDLQTPRPYNTYRLGGLPPGPIASVSIDSIRAVLEPAPVKYLYFVARNDGTHEFSNTLVEHNKAVRRFQLPGARPPEPAEPDPDDESAISATAR
jgi:UPF0755 protein